MKTTRHKYLHVYPIKLESEKLILGTIHPHDNNSFLLPFFYGSKLSIWKILNQAFPNELKSPITLNNILTFLSSHKIAISDTIIECTRNSNSALDKDLIPTKLNYEIVEQIRTSEIKEILFTSGFGKNNAFKLFYTNILGLKITSEIRKTREVILEKEYCGRPIKLTVLYSPSGTANTGLVRSKIYQENKHKYEGASRPVQRFKVDYYKEKFQISQ